MKGIINPLNGEKLDLANYPLREWAVALGHLVEELKTKELEQVSGAGYGLRWG